MSLTNVWVRTLGDGLVRADQVVGVDAHRTPALSGKPARWLLDVVGSVPAGSGGRDGWAVTALHRTVVQTDDDPGAAPVELARLLAELDAADARGVVVAERARPGGEVGERVRFRFTPFAPAAPAAQAARSGRGDGEPADDARYR